jgi:LuxR family transcriptional regulator, quorum-sensing system regulator CinR
MLTLDWLELRHGRHRCALPSCFEGSPKLGVPIVSNRPEEKTLTEALAIIDDTPDMEVTINKLRELLNIDHVVYYLPKPGGAPYVRLTYPASWIKRYLEMNYGEIDPISRESLQRAHPFNWKELELKSTAEASFMADAAAHGVGPHGFSIPLNNHGCRALFSISSSRSEQEWTAFLTTTQATLVQIANQLHRRAIVEAFGRGS